ncbi:GNAT family N-acetyltransferase [Streptomyces sp. B6B3]|uniref:GNAT family N-acetyltransferase n=1 Tax=Streptomyces sp. B6B3 TaxID=3153570 RepID=UPI00325D41DC
MTDRETARTVPVTSDAIAADNRSRAATAADITELTRLRSVMLSSLGQDPGGEGAPWRKQAAVWFSERLARPEEWALRVVGPPGGPLDACGAAWLIEQLPGPAAPDGRRGYIGFMCTRPGARRRGHGSSIFNSLVEWLATRGVARLELHAAPDGLDMYRRAGFNEDQYLAMYRMGSPPE